MSGSCGATATDSDCEWVSGAYCSTATRPLVRFGSAASSIDEKHIGTVSPRCRQEFGRRRCTKVKQIRAVILNTVWGDRRGQV